jgi:hypothetical protein
VKKIADVREICASRGKSRVENVDWRRAVAAEEPMRRGRLRIWTAIVFIIIRGLVMVAGAGCGFTAADGHTGSAQVFAGGREIRIGSNRRCIELSKPADFYSSRA